MARKEKDSANPNSESTSEEQDRSPEDLEKTTGKETEASDGPGSEDEGEIEEVTAGPGALDFSHPLLKGKTPQEIEALVKTQESTIREQGTELNKRFDTQPSAPAPGTPTRESGRAEERETPDFGDDFIGPRFKTLYESLHNDLNEMIEPIRKQVQTGTAKTVREQLRETLPHFETLEPHIDRLLRENGQNPNTADEASLQNLYYMAVGIANTQGVNLSTETETETPKQSTEEKTPVSIPQRRPSSAPLPSESQRGGGRRKLTENEKRLAHEMFKNEKDPEGAFLEWQNMEEDEVVEPGFSKETWK